MTWLQRLVLVLTFATRWLLIIVSPIWSPLPFILRRRKWLWLQHLHRLPTVLSRAEARLQPTDASIMYHYRLRLAEIKGVAEWAEQLRQVRYNEAHANQFSALWKALKPEAEASAPSIPSPAWSEIGFQGKDPSTDLRGGGLAGLDFLVFFAEIYSDAARRSLLQASHPKYWMPFSCAGINIAVFLLRDLLGKPEQEEPRLLTPHLLQHGCTPDELRKVFCHLLVQLCDAYVAAKPENVMAFPGVMTAFQERVRSQLLATGVLWNHINETRLAPRDI